jgi:hypothetical protein
VGNGAGRQPAAGPRLYLDRGGKGGGLASAAEALAGKVEALGDLV